MAGGVEKMSIDLARGLKSRGHDVCIISLDGTMSVHFYTMPKSITWVKMGIGDPSKKANTRVRILRVLLLRRYCKQNRFDLGIGFQVGSFALLKFATIGLPFRVIAAERNSPTLYNYVKNGKRRKFVNSIILLFAFKISIQFESFRKLYPRYLHRKILVTPNYVKQSDSIRKVSYGENFQILFIGRLSYQKNVKILISALEMLPKNFKLTIVGAGEDLINLKSLAKKFPNRVKFLPPRKKLNSLYLKSDLFCLPSLWEGFPNVVGEALSFGLPVVGFRDCAGVKELITDNLNGVIANGNNDVNALVEAIYKASLLKFSPRKIQSSVSKYSYEKFIDDWGNCLR